MRTPGQDAELAVGFLFTESIINNKKQLHPKEHILSVNNIVVVPMANDFEPNLANAERNFYTTSSCGVCGKASIEAIKTVSSFTEISDEPRIKITVFYGLQATLLKQQAVFADTGGIHAAALFTPSGDFIALREDVGRHNALDKLIGAAVLEESLPLSNHILLLSGRASFELVQKATMAGIRIIAAVGAPSSLAVQLAEDSGITLIGFLRDNRFNIYCHPQRVIE